MKITPVISNQTYEQCTFFNHDGKMCGKTRIPRKVVSAHYLLFHFPVDTDQFMVLSFNSWLYN